MRTFREEGMKDGDGRRTYHDPLKRRYRVYSGDKIPRWVLEGDTSGTAGLDTDPKAGSYRDDEYWA